MGRVFEEQFEIGIKIPTADHKLGNKVNFLNPMVEMAVTIKIALNYMVDPISP